MCGIVAAMWANQPSDRKPRHERRRRASVFVERAKEIETALPRVVRAADRRHLLELAASYRRAARNLYRNRLA